MDDWRPTIDDGGGPRYKALVAALERDVQAGRLKPGTRLPTQRALAHELGWTLSTVTRAFTLAEQRGLIAGEVGRGTFVRDQPIATQERWEQPAWRDTGANLAVASLRTPAPTQEVAEAIAAIGRDQVDALRDYAPTHVDPAFTQPAADWLGEYIGPLEPERIVLTLGAQHGIAVCLSALAQAGEAVFVDAVTYPAARTLAQQLGLRVIGVAMDEAGMRPDGLAAAARHNRGRAVYLMPNMQNPTAGIMPLERRQDLLRVAGEHDLAVLEDDAYGPLQEVRPTSLVTLAPGQVFHIASLSKVALPGLRVGFVTAPPAWTESLATVVRQSLWMVPRLDNVVARTLMADGTIERYRQRRMEELRARQAIAAEYLPTGRYEAHPTGLFLWLALPEPWTGDQFAQAAQARGVWLWASSAFACQRGEALSHVRISLAYAAERETLRRGLASLRDLLIKSPVPAMTAP